MNSHVYNAVTFVAWLLVSTGAGMIYLPAGLITAGLGLIAALLLTLALARRHYIRPPQPKRQDAT